MAVVTRKHQDYYTATTIWQSFEVFRGDAKLNRRSWYDLQAQYLSDLNHPDSTAKNVIALILDLITYEIQEFTASKAVDAERIRAYWHRTNGRFNRTHIATDQQFTAEAWIMRFRVVPNECHKKQLRMLEYMAIVINGERLSYGESAYVLNYFLEYRGYGIAAPVEVAA